MARDPLPIECTALRVGHNHLLCDLWFDQSEKLKYVPPLRAALIEAARAGGARICHSHFYQFSPWGVTGYLLLKESHISLHTWVEERYAALDVYGCGSMDPLAIVRCLVERLAPAQVVVLSARRGGSRTRIDVAHGLWRGESEQWQTWRERGAQYVVCAQGEPVAVLLSINEYEHYLDLLDDEADSS